MAHDDLALLRAHEPVLCFTKGELFFPCAVGPYVERCSLWAKSEDGETTQLVPTDSLVLNELCHLGRERRELSLHLRFVDRPLDRRAYRRWRKQYKQRLSGTARFAATGYLGRLADAGFRLTLIVRGKVPGGQAAAAEIEYRESVAPHGDVYYGRVVREGGYVALQYWFFYAMNDWRSTFSGVNDHEADWEMVTVYLADGGPDGRSNRAVPQWVAYSSHDYRGDDLRRRWDDTELVREGGHPVVFPGAGSHSGAFIAGDYVSSVSPESLERPLRALQAVSRRLLPWTRDQEESSGLGIPFVDYSRGDGVRVGPGTDRPWSPVLIDDDTDWVRDYRGLWGLDTGDPFGGERAPSGPRYERDGSVRPSWANPLGWAGLQKVPPTDADRERVLAEEITRLEAELADLDAEVDRARDEVRQERMRSRSLRTADDTRPAAEAVDDDIAKREALLDAAVVRGASVRQQINVHRRTLSAPFPVESPQAHLRHKHVPLAHTQTRRRRFLRIWGAVSAPLIIAAFFFLIADPNERSFAGFAIMLFAFFAVEAFARRRFLAFIGTVILLVLAVSIGSALAAAFVQNWQITVGAVLGVAAVALLIANVRDLRGR